MNEGAAPKRRHPGTIAIRFIKAAPEQIFAGPAVVAFASDADFKSVLLIVAIFVAFGLLFQSLTWWRFTYTAMADELLIESGILSRNRRSIPWDRIQDVDIEQGLLHRLFGLAKVKLETGAAGRDEGDLDSVSLGEARALRDRVRGRRAGDVPAEKARAEEAVFALNTAQILQAGLLTPSVIWLAAVVGASQLLDNVLPVGFDDAEAWVTGHQRELIGLASIGNLLALLVVLVSLTFLAGIARMLLANYGFRLSREIGGLRRVRGLLTRSEVVIPAKRIQLAVVRGRWLQRIFGMRQVYVQTLGGAGGAVGGLQELAPIATPAESALLLRLAGAFEEPPASALAPVSPLHAWVDTATDVAFFIPATAALIWYWPAAAPLAVLPPALALGNWIAARPHAWLIKGGTLIVRKGWFSQDLTILPLSRIQSVSLHRGWIQRRLALASLVVDSAGSGLGGLRIANLETGVAQSLFDTIKNARPERP